MNRAIVRMSGLAGVLCAGPVLFSPAAGAEFSWQVSGSYRDDADANTLESNRSALAATWYFSPVDDETGPYELAPFLNRASLVTVDLARTTLRERIMPPILVSEASGDVMFPDDFVPFEGTPVLLDIPTEAGIDTSEYAVHGRYVWPGSGWYAGARAERGDVDPWPQVPFVEDEVGAGGIRLVRGQILRLANGGGTGVRVQDVESGSTAPYGFP